ncbi:hypothetical protein BH10PSE1_BH10PSE1_24720 [soil metagenome]
MSWILSKALVGVLTGLVIFVMAPVVASAQATSRTCIGQAGEVPGPACLVAHQDIEALPEMPLYWAIFTFADVESAERARPTHGVVVQAFSRVWMFDLGAAGRQIEGGRHIADIGPLPIENTKGDFSADYLKSTFAPGMTAPIHVHSGPEAFYALSGASCLETPDGVQVARGAGHSLMVRQGPPMLLMSIGEEMRRGFALILHGEGTPATTLTSAWTPQGLCPAE